ncbi:signal transducer and activator of transcription 5A-like [Bradysia coprophila]|uniref:signal transducer and activator of transcription 5A-like n=1 Tax=Bradysia coprophila TaxID=38358 RepID=UPI00187DB0B8|nr:signal transducer and activator of transcription 5A-like [Bradysia coprophila]
MATWNSLISHPHFHQIKTAYNDHFPIEVRFVCANWIEERMKTELNNDINDTEIKEIATDFLCALIQELQQEKLHLKRVDQLSIQYRLNAAIECYKNHLSHPFAVYKQIRDTVAYELRVLGVFSENLLKFGVDEEAIDIVRKLNVLKSDVLTIKEKQTNYKHEIENYKCLEYRETTTQMIEVNNDLEQERRLVVLQDYQGRKFQAMENIKACAIDLNQGISDVILQIDSVQKLLVLSRLDKWHRSQALAGNGAPLNKNSLDEMQLWFEKLAEIIWTTRCCIQSTCAINSITFSDANGVIEQAYKDVTCLLVNLIESGFVVEDQPPQIMKPDVNFKTTVRLLTANLGIHLNHPSVAVSLFAESPMDSPCRSKCQTYEILNNTGKLEDQSSTHHLTCTFNNMKLEKFKRSGKKDPHYVTEKKYALLFESAFQTAGDLTINVSAKTLPIVIVVHTNQEPQSWATIFWDNAFAEIHRQPFKVVDKVRCSQLFSALSTKFESETNKCLTADCFKYLHEKLFEADYNDEDRLISWAQFCKVPLLGRKFTFWQWFYSAMKLVKHHAQEAWSDGFIIGFINKQETIAKLQNCQAGTFLVRFSESELGGISIAWVDTALPRSTVMLEPYFSDDLKKRSLADRIRDLDQCVTLYPNIPKGLAFNRHYSRLVVKHDKSGYVRSVLRCTVPNREGNSRNCNCMQHFMQLLSDINGDSFQSLEFS